MNHVTSMLSLVMTPTLTLCLWKVPWSWILPEGHQMVSAVVANKLCYLLKCIIYIKSVDLSSDCTIHLQPEASLLFVLPNLKVKVNYFFHMNKLRSIIMIRLCWKRKCQHWRCFLRNWLHLFLNINSGWMRVISTQWLKMTQHSITVSSVTVKCNF